MFEKELRYLLHGSIDNYDDVETPLYITPHSSPLWEKVRLQVLNSEKEAWNFIDSVLVKYIPPNQLENLKIEEFKIDAVITTILNLPTPYDFYDIILDLLPELSDELKESLKTKNWLPCNGDKSAISPSKIINIIPNKLQKHLSTLIALSADEYIEAQQLSLNILNHKNFHILRNLFTKWYENDIFEFIFTKRNPHTNYPIILDVFSSLWMKQPQKLPNTNNQIRLKTEAWLVTKQENAVYPKKVLHYPNLNQEINDLLSKEEVYPDYISSSKLAERICDSDCWQWLAKEVFITGDEALIKIGEIFKKFFKQLPEYQLGEFASVEEFPLDKCLDAFRYFDVSFLRAWKFAQNLPKKKFKDYLLPNLLLGKMEADNLRQLLILLSNFDLQADAANAANVEIFNIYLRLAINYETFSTKILSPPIRLLNRNGQWKCLNQLSGENANIDKNYLLDEEQFNIIFSFLNLATQDNNNLPKSDKGLREENSKDSFDVLINYFKEWEPYCPLEPIGAFLSLFTSSDHRIKEQAEFYLGKRNREGLRKRLLKNTTKPIRPFQAHIGQAGNRTCNAISLLGVSFEAELANLPNPTHFFLNEGGLASNRMELLHIQPEQIARDELVRILKDSTKVLLTKVYGIELNSIEAIWEDLLNSDQLDIQVAENYLIESAPHVLRTLGIKDDFSIPARLILTRLKELDDLRHQKAEYKQQGLEKEQQDTERSVQEKLSKLSNLLKKNEGVKDILLKSVRRKITEHGYRQQSIPFELFQNADDAVVEWQEMSLPIQLEDQRKEFVVVMGDRKLSFIHAGRPIGCFQHPDHPQAKNRYRNIGYDRDLEKMLTFNISDKGDGVTGMFGLGFKSVYLSCKRPRILSKRLGFAVEGGLIPSLLTPEETRDLQDRLDFYRMPSDATIIELELDGSTQPQDIIGEFQELAGILTVFSRTITTYRFIRDSTDNYQELFTWKRQPFLGIQDIEVNKITINGEDSVRLCLRTTSGSALLLDMTERDGSLSCTTPNAPTFWVTAPTQEKLSVGFLLNAAFKVTTGRTKLDPTGHNQELADQIGIEIGKLLEELCRANWEKVKTALGFSINNYRFWEFIWKELAVNWQELDTNDERRDLISRILGGDRGMGYLITNCNALPNGLFGQYRQLIRINRNTRYSKVTGKLAEESCFSEVANWSSFQESYSCNWIVDTQWEEAKKLLGQSLLNRLTINIDDIQLLNVLQTEAGARKRVTPEQAKRIGKLISKPFLNSFSNSFEYDKLKNFLPHIQFQSSANDSLNSSADDYLPSEQLLSKTSEQTEEKLLAALAPKNCLLHIDYTDTALNFFYACRLQRRSITVGELKEWVLRAEMTEKRKAVYDYLSKGEHREQLAKLLYQNIQGSWIIEDQSINKLIQSTISVITEREKEYQPEQIDSIIESDQQGLGDNPEEWGKFGENEAIEFYKSLGYKEVIKQPDEGGYGYDLLCKGGNSELSELFVEVKTINPTYNDIIRLTSNEWRKMCEIQNLDKYELFIVYHNAELVTNRIRIKSAWKTLQEIFSKLALQPLSNSKYGSSIDVLIGLQRNSINSSNDILLNWKKLVRNLNDCIKNNIENV